MAQEARGVAAKVHLETVILQDGKTEQHVFELDGKVAQIGESIYLRYEEVYDELPDPIPVMMRISENEIQITRKSDSKLTLKLAYNKEMTSQYETPYGVMPMTTVTSFQKIILNEFPLSGEVAADYDLFMNKQNVGNYKLRLHFTA